MRRRELLAAAGLALTGCLGGPTPDGPEATTSSEEAPGGGTVVGGGTPVAPLVHFEFDLDAEREQVTVAHGGGEDLTADRTERIELVLTTAPDHPIPTDATLTPTLTPQVFTTTWREAGGRYPIAEGDAVDVEPATPGDTLAVVWYGEDAHRAGTRLVSVTFSKV